MFPTDCCDETNRFNIARRFGSAMMSNTDSMSTVYTIAHIRNNVYADNSARYIDPVEGAPLTRAPLTRPGPREFLRPKDVNLCICGPWLWHRSSHWRPFSSCSGPNLA